MKKNISKLLFALFIILPIAVQIILFIISLVVRLLGNSEKKCFSIAEIIDFVVLFLLCLLVSIIISKILKKHFSSLSNTPINYTFNNDSSSYEQSAINSSDSNDSSKVYTDNSDSSHIDGSGYYR